MNVGDKVVLTKNIWDPASDESPGGMLGKRGDILIIKEVSNRAHPFMVAHEWYMGAGGFCVNDTEIKPL